MVIKYIPSARHQLLGSGAPQRGLAGSWELGRGIALPGWLACSLAWRAAVLAAMCKAEEFQASSVPRPAPEESREKCCGAWLRGALAGRASSCLSGSHERRGSSGKPEHPRLISLFFSFSLLLLLTSLSLSAPRLAALKQVLQTTPPSHKGQQLISRAGLKGKIKMEALMEAPMWTWLLTYQFYFVELLNLPHS